MWEQIDDEWAELEGLARAKHGSVALAASRWAAPSVPRTSRAVSFLASRDSDYMTGQAINVDGGLVMGN